MEKKLAWAALTLIPLIFLGFVVWNVGWLGMLLVLAGIVFCLVLAGALAWAFIQISDL